MIREGNFVKSSKKGQLTAHDIRHWVGCENCEGLADDRVAIKTPQGWMHGICAFKCLGVEGILELPMKERGKLTLGDIPIKYQRKIFG